MTVNGAGGSLGRVQAIDRAVDLLEAIADAGEPMTAPVLAEVCGLNRSTAWRLLRTLEQRGLVDRDADTNQFHVGLGIVRLAASAGSRALVRKAHPMLLQLAQDTGETANLAVVHHLDLVYADQVDGEHVMVPNWLGRSIPLHATATGKAFLAMLPDEQVRAAAPPPLEAFTETTITDERALSDALEEVRSAGYATSEGEFEPIMWGAGAAVRDRSGAPVAVVSLWGAEHRARNRLVEHARRCMATAAAIEAVL